MEFVFATNLLYTFLHQQMYAMKLLLLSSLFVKFPVGLFQPINIKMGMSHKKAAVSFGGGNVHWHYSA